MIKPKLKVDVYLVTDGDYVVSYCPSLELSSYGHTATEARRAFSEALEIFLEETTRKGTLERVLLGLGWKLQQRPKFKYIPPPLSRSREHVSLKRRSSRVVQATVAMPTAR